MRNVITKSNYDKEIEYLRDEHYITITKEISIDTEKIKRLLAQNPNCTINILSGYDKSDNFQKLDILYDERQLLALNENANLIKEITGEDVVFDEKYTLDQAINASNQINDMVNKIKTATFQGRSLSTYEKYLYAYSFVNSRPYREYDKDNNETFESARSLIAVLNNDKCVCVAFAGLLAALCYRLDIPVTFIPACIDEKQENGQTKRENHLACLVRIEDQNYNLNGIYWADATSQPNAKGFNPLNALIPLNQVKQDASGNAIHVQHLFDPIYFMENRKTPYDMPDNIEKRDILLSPLFPEKTQSKDQSTILLEQALREVDNSQLKSEIINFIQSFTETDYIEALKNYYREHIDALRINIWFNNGDLETKSLDSIRDMIKNGFTKDEAIEFLQELYNEEVFYQARYTFCKKYSENDVVLDNAMHEQLLTKCKILKEFKQQLPQLATSIESPETNAYSPFSDNTVSLTANINFELNKFINLIIEKYLFGNEVNKSSPTLKDIGIYIKHGVPINVITDTLIKGLDSTKIAQELLDHQKLSIYPNEQEFYIDGKLGIMPDPIYNEPYEEDFKKLVKSATLPDAKAIAIALLILYKSQGFSDDEAKRKTQELIISNMSSSDNSSSDESSTD